MPYTITVKNRSTKPFTGYVKAAIPIDQPLEINGEPVEQFPIKHNRTSLAVWKETIGPGEEKIVKPSATNLSPLPWNIHPDVITLAGSGMFQLAFGIGLKSTPQSEYAWTNILGNPKIVQNGTCFKTIRFHSNFPGIPAASATVYMTIYEMQSFGELTVVFENGTVESPIANGLPIHELALYFKSPFKVGIYSPESNGIIREAAFMGYEKYLLLSNQTLGDGQSWAIKGVWSIGDNTESADAMLENPTGSIVGIADLDSWRFSKALGATGFIPTPRPSTREQRRDAVEYRASRSVTGTCFQPLGYVNQNPPNTGDQADFLAGNPLPVIQAVQAESSAPLHELMIGVYKESLRPSFYWYQNYRASQVTFPDIFFWSGRFHWDWSWNTGKVNAEPWHSRITGFEAGPHHGWGGADNQHAGNNHLRGAYELTGDPYLGDILNYYLSLNAWNYFTGKESHRGWFWNTDAERAHRLIKEVVCLIEYAPSDPVAQWLRQKVIEKNDLVIETEVFRRSSAPYHYSAIEDNRTGLYRRCIANEWPHITYCGAVVCWQTGFHMESQTLQYQHNLGRSVCLNILRAYLQTLTYYFEVSTGQPVTFFLQADPSIRDYGGIGESWQNGWLRLLEIPELQTEPNFAALQTIKTRLNAGIESSPIVDQFFRMDDDWKVCE